MSRARPDGRSWRAALREDGLDPVRTSVVVRAADGGEAAMSFEGQLDPDKVDELHSELVALSRDPTPLRTPPWRTGHLARSRSGGYPVRRPARSAAVTATRP